MLLICVLNYDTRPGCLITAVHGFYLPASSWSEKASCFLASIWVLSIFVMLSYGSWQDMYKRGISGFTSLADKTFSHSWVVQERKFLSEKYQIFSRIWLFTRIKLVQQWVHVGLCLPYANESKFWSDTIKGLESDHLSWWSLSRGSPVFIPQTWHVSEVNSVEYKLPSRRKIRDKRVQEMFWKFRYWLCLLGPVYPRRAYLWQNTLEVV